MSQNDNERPIRVLRRRVGVGNCRSSLLMICYCLLLCLHTCLASRRLPEDEAERRGPGEEESKQSKLTDVWLALASALGWTLWMVASHVRPIIERYSSEGIVVYGNVLQTRVSEEYAIPTFHAVIDYVLPDEDATQVRKELQSQVLLQAGFANVEVLVLPTDPTSGMLKKDWERQYEEYLEAEQSRQQARIWSLVLGAILVILSIIGAIAAVLRLPVEVSIWGWVSIVAGAALLWPVAVLLYANGTAFARLVTQTKEEGGIIIRGKQPPLPFSLSPFGSMDMSEMETQKIQNQKSPAHGETELVKPVSRGVMVPPCMRSSIQTDPEVVEESRGGCYFVDMPRRQQSYQSGVSSVSTTATSRNDKDAAETNQTGFPFLL